MMTTNTTNNYQIKRKTANEKEILEFFSMLEDKFENNTQKLQSFVEILTKYANSNEEDILQKMRDVLSDSPILILELNKMLPKSSRLPLVDQENADNFLLKVREKDENAFKEIMKSLFAFKKEEISQEKLISKFEEHLLRHSDLLEEAYLFLDYKKISNAAYKKNLMNKLAQTNRSEIKKPPVEQKQSFNKYKDTTGTPTKIQSNPEYLFFESLRNVLDRDVFKTVIKLLHIFNEGVLNFAEFIDLVQPYLSNHNDLFEYLKTLTYSKMMNRRQYSLINKPLSEIDLSKSTRICTSYSELPKDYPNLICSGRNKEISSMLNDRLISIPSGSEDDKNPMKKNHYEEHIFKFEDQRYEIDMIIEILKFSIEELITLNERVLNENLENVELEKVLGSSTIRFISFFYKEYYSQVLQGIKTHPREAVPIVINRFKKRIDEATSQKNELDKNIKLSFDRFYYKSFDHRSFKLKNFEKKSNNAKAFMKELTLRKKEKLISQNINILKGGSENFEFYYSINFKLSRELVNKTLSQSEDKILMKKIELNDLENVSIRKKLPDMRIIIDNIEIFKVAVSLIFYQIYFSNLNDCQKVCETLSSVFENIFKINVNDLVNLLYNPEISRVGNDKEINYSEIIDSIKNKTVDPKILDKFYNIDFLSNNINVISELSNSSNFEYSKNNILTKENLSQSPGINNNIITLKSDITCNNDNNSEISLTPSLQSQDTGKTYKDMVILEEYKENIHSLQSEKLNEENKLIEAMFLPLKEKDHILFYANENWFVLIRFIFCVYERMNKLYEYSLSVSNSYDGNLYLNKKDQSSKENLILLPGLETVTFKNFIVIYKALIHKKIESSSIYEELCRDILGNESYFLFNLDKLINSLIKSVSIVNNDNLSKDIINLFAYEKSRKNTVSESLYFSNFTKLFDGTTPISTYRLLFAPVVNVMTIHLNEFTQEINKKEYLDSFKEFLDTVLQESYQKLEEENLGQDEPFTIFLERNKRQIMKKRDITRPLIRENNLLFKFDFATKKLEFLKSGCDVLIYSKKPFNKIDRLKNSIKKNLTYRIWADSKISHSK